MSKKGNKLTIASSSSGSIGSSNSGSSSSSSFGDNTRTRNNRHQVTDSAYDNEFEIELSQISASSNIIHSSTTNKTQIGLTNNITFDSTKSIKSILRSVILKVHRHESEDMAARIVNESISLPFLKSLIKFRLAYKTKVEEEEGKEGKDDTKNKGIYSVDKDKDKAVQLLKSRLVDVEIESATKEHLHNILREAVTEDVFSVEAADAEETAEKLAAIENITTEDIERHFDEVSNTKAIYNMLLERYGKGIDEYRVFSVQNDTFSKYIYI